MNQRAKPYSVITQRDSSDWKGSIQSLHCWHYTGVKAVTQTQGMPGNDLILHLSSGEQEVPP